MPVFPAQESTPAHREVVGLIRAHGPIPFARFMEIALYGEHSYYTTPRNHRADYLTSPQTHREFGACVARCLARMWDAMGRPRRFRVAELGAGDGELMRQINEPVTTGNEDSTDRSLRFADALEYSAYDLWPSRVDDSAAIEPIAELNASSDDFQCVLSNELLDAFPVRRFAIQHGQMRELMVDVEDSGALRETVGEQMHERYTARLGRPLTAFANGYVGEIADGINDWVAGVAKSVNAGYVLTIDYGHPREALFHPDRVGGTLRCYHKHVLGSDPFRRVGEQDITAHVDFTHLQRCFSQRGFAPSVPLMSQADFLDWHGYESAVRTARLKLAQARDLDDANAISSDLKSLRALADPRVLGGFLVAIHGRGVPDLLTQSC